MTTTTTARWGHAALEDIRDIVDTQAFASYALRAMTVFSSEDEALPAPAVGDTLAPSRHWIDGDPTDDLLRGTCGLAVDTDTNLTRAAFQLTPYFARWIVLIGSDEADHGEDADEVILPAARVLAVYDRGEVTCDQRTWS